MIRDVGVSLVSVPQYQNTLRHLLNCRAQQTLARVLLRKDLRRLRSHMYKKTRTAEVTICIIPERTARSPTTVTELLKANENAKWQKAKGKGSGL